MWDLAGGGTKGDDTRRLGREDLGKEKSRLGLTGSDGEDGEEELLGALGG